MYEARTARSFLASAQRPEPSARSAAPSVRRQRLHFLSLSRSNTSTGRLSAERTLSSQTKHSFIAAIEKSHGPQLRRFLSSRLRAGRADAADLVQEIFLRLLRIKDHETIRNPQAYLFTVASHVLHQHALEQAKRPETMDPLELVSELRVDMAPDPAEEVEMQQRLHAIGGELERVSPRAYAALVMYRCEGMTLQEIGQRLGVSHVMVRKYLARAIAYCDQRLEELG